MSAVGAPRRGRALFRTAALAVTGGLFVLLLVLTAATRVQAEGPLHGDVPAPGSMGLVVWSGGGVEGIAGALAGGGCSPASVWANGDGTLVGYLFGAPEAVNGRFHARYAGGTLPERTPLVLKCADSDLAAVPVAAGFAATTPEAATTALTLPAGLVPDTAAEARMLLLVNEERRTSGLEELALDAELTAVARLHSYDMLTRDFFAHTNPDGLTPFQRMEAAGVVFGWAAENLAWGPGVEWAHQALMSSTGHRENILNPNLRRIGVGVVGEGRQQFFTQAFTD